MKTLKNSLFIVLMVALASCSSVKVVTDLDKTHDFSSYKTYSFLGWQADSDKIINDMDRKRFRDAFKNEFEARGLEFVQENGDMAVSLFIVVDQKTSTTAYTNYYGGGGYGYGRYRGGWGGGHASTTYTESDYLEGTLVMDVFDGQSKDQVWQAIATGTVTEKPEKRDTSIPKTIAALMKEFPLAPVE
ncbi:MAG: DUF4136 domain-containing protein [Melioribacteraceae bacterium]|nr:DUF4136 domain-containing protein [Melioribacteraceae bacterium]